MRKVFVDWWIVIPSIILLSLGFVILNTTAPQQAQTQLLFLVVSTIAFLIVSQIDFELFAGLHFITYISSLVFLITPFIFGAVSRGALRWLQIGNFTLQPSELIKPFLLITFSVIAVSKNQYRTLYQIALAALPIFLIFIQPDLGTTLVVGVAWVTILLTNIPIKVALIGILILAIAALPVYQFVLHDYQKDRLTTFINPYQDPLGKGYHVIQSVIAVGSGQFIGRGLGQGTQSTLKFLPEYHTDFIFASLSESLGFVGGFIVIITYALLIRRIYIISQSVTNPTASVFCIAVAALISFQSFVNIGMNIGIAPVTGVTLPLISYGGSSLLSMAITLGIISSISSSRPTYNA